MSWPTWHGGPPSTMPGVIAAPLQSALMPATINPAPTLIPPGGAATAAAQMQYTPEQWAQMQQQNWQQWAQWQQQYQQWHQQYGAEYQKSISALSTAGPNTSIPPPPPNENKPPPPPPPEDAQKAPSYYNNAGHSTGGGYSTVPPTGQQYSSGPTPLQYSANEWQTVGGGGKRPFPANNNFESNKRQMLENTKSTGWPAATLKNVQPAQQPSPKSQPALKVLNLEELTEAETKFDKEFAAWEAQFNKWKEQNANHPDKAQYMEYEKKWESWRNSLLDRREQMRKKRVSLQSQISNAGQSKPMLPAQNFTHPPPHPALLPNEVFSKPPPTKNNEPLTFKSPNKFPETLTNSKEIQNDETGSNFLNSSSSPVPGGIPGLDLVKENESNENVSDSIKPIVNSKPDLEAISKGINTILGDPKLLNMLSMVSQSATYNSNSIQTVDLAQNVTKQSNIPSLLSLPIQRPVFDKSNQSFDDYSETVNNFPSESINNFDDQTRMSFTNGPNEQDVPLAENNFGFRSSSNFRRFGSSEERFKGRNNRFENVQETETKGPNFSSVQKPRLHFNNTYNQSLNTSNNNNNGNHYENQEEEEYEKYHSMFSEDHNDPPRQIPTENSLSLSAECNDEPLFVPETVTDYEHKSSKEPEPDVSLEVVHTFDYRHKSVNRIPYPQRPIWLVSSLRNIRQFDPLGRGRFNKEHEPNFEQSRYSTERNQHQQFDNNKVRDNNTNYGFARQPDKNVESRLAGTKERYTDYNSPKKTYPNRPEVPSKAKNNVVEMPDLEELSEDDDQDWTDDNNDVSNSVQPSLSTQLPANKQNIALEDLINVPDRHGRPPKLVIILRGPPGSGKTHLAKLIKDREVENGGSAPRILSLDDYFMVEHEKDIIEDGKRIRIKEMTYEYEAEMEESYRQSLIRAFKKTITDGYFPFVIVDNINQKIRNFGEMWSFAKQNGFQVYICQMELDLDMCKARNVHHKSETYIKDCISGWEPTPAHHPLVDPTSFLQSADSITEVEMEEIDLCQDEDDNVKDEERFGSKWDTFDCSLNNLARLDGVSKPLRPSRTMEEYLQLDDDWTEPSSAKSSKPGQKRVRWADLEEQRQQQKMKALGFVVGHTNWDKMMNPSSAENALIQTKYIESRHNRDCI